jgi:hypothetical protein
MAFRCYYLILFRTYQQKDRSAFLNRLWAEDFFKAKWAIVAKAYSMIRDRLGKARAPISPFLAIAIPHIGILQPLDYFREMGWILPTSESDLGRLFKPLEAAFVTVTTMSAFDLVQFVESRGYGDGGAGEFTRIFSLLQANLIMNTGNFATPGEVALTMAVEPIYFNADTNNTALEGVATGLGFETVAAFETAQSNGPVPAIEMQYHENGAILAASGSVYPFSEQFNPADADAQVGLHFEPKGSAEYECFNMDSYIDFAHPIFRLHPDY